MDLDDGVAASSNPSSGWNLYKLAGFGSGKFFYPPDVVLTSGFGAVIIGSGDREKPLSTTSSDKIYMLKDAMTGFSGAGQTPITTASGSCTNTAAVVLNSCSSAEIGAARGWYYALNTAGEKVVNGPLTVGGVVYLGTNKPTPGGACTGNLGEARSYALDFFTGAGTRTPGGTGTGDDAYSIVLSPLTGLPPSPVAGLVDVGGTVVPFCIGCGERRSALEAGVPDIEPTPVRRKIFWKFKNDK
jgi:type IV pilus assembly protein PilY1